MEKRTSPWFFTGDHGEFEIENPHLSSYLYFPLANEAGMMAAVTPTLHGDLKSSHNQFLLEPVSSMDLHNSRAGRNFWIYTDEDRVWSATGNSPEQLAQLHRNSEENVKLEAGLLWHKMTRLNNAIGIKAEILNFVPANQDKVELMQVTLTNIKNVNLRFTPTAAIPIYGRSADNLRDHRHVTSLLNQTLVKDYGVVVNPTLTFDERGHKENSSYYCVLGADDKGKPPLGCFPDVETYVGEGGNLEWPEAVVKNTGTFEVSGAQIDGFEALGGLRFDKVKLGPGESIQYSVLLGIGEDARELDNFESYCKEPQKIEALLEETKKYWNKKVDDLSFYTSDNPFNQWMKWVTIQPKLRQIFGCSFLPHHDYGRGGRGWRDLWQDCLALLVQNPDSVRADLLNNFAGIRFDGSNATIIGTKPGEFIADRNKIPRVWMDHGVWPFLTTQLYIDQSGDLLFMLEEQTYFKDSHTHRAHGFDHDWTEKQGNKLLMNEGQVYKGTVLEHILIQHLTCFFNVGDHNIIKLEGADWNDGLDMAEEKGESVAFTALYGSNLQVLSEYVSQLKKTHGITNIELASELVILLDGLNSPIDYDSINSKNELLKSYFDGCTTNVSGKKISISIDDLVKDLQEKAEWIKSHIQRNEWIETAENEGWFNGYYDNAGEQLEGNGPDGIRMTLTGQVFSLMGNIATDEQAQAVVKSCEKHLKDPSIGGYRLNTNFKEVKLNMGRMFGFAYGHKENGAMFSHMAVMYANALYKRGFVREGFDVINSIFMHCSEFDKSRVYPGIPEYINEKGRGLYHYLTGSASWLLLTVLTETFGVKGLLGDLVLEPKLVNQQFDLKNQASVKTTFAGRQLHVVYEIEDDQRAYPYRISSVSVNEKIVLSDIDKPLAKLPRDFLSGLGTEGVHKIHVKLK